MVSGIKNTSITRKERAPITTIRIIRKELSEWKIRTKIVKILKTKQFYSVRLELRDLAGVGVNGKGISLAYALASAYSEFMERFLSGFLVKSSFFNKDRSVFLLADESISDYETFYRKWKVNVENILFPNISRKEMIWETVKKNSKFRKQAPFQNLITRKRESFPIALINSVAHTNGLCAGNSQEEALVQGICEIFERYCYRRIVTEKISTPIIDVGNALEDELGWLKKKGYSYEIRDFFP